MWKETDGLVVEPIEAQAVAAGYLGRVSRDSLGRVDEGIDVRGGLSVIDESERAPTDDDNLGPDAVRGHGFGQFGH
jgi:hypothetical protein